MAPRFALLSGAVVASVAAVVAGKEMPVDVIPPTKVCPREYDLLGKTCVRESWREPRFACEDKHAKLRDGMCVSSMHIEGEYVCPPGFHRKGKNKCFSIETQPAEFTCPQGAIADCAGECLVIEESEPYYSCPHGFKKSSDGLCFAETKYKGDEVCPPGSTPSKYGCVTYEMADSLISCPKGYDLFGEQCVKTKNHKMYSHCPKGFHGVKKGLHDSQNECVRVVRVEGSVYCDQGVLDGKKCRTVYDTMPSYECRKGFELIDGQCIKTLIEAPRAKCPKGHKFDGARCMRSELHAAVIICPDGQVAKHGKCEELEYLPITHKCAKGSRLVNGECVSEHITSPREYCPHGFRMTDEGCKKATKIPSERICPTGELDGHFCVTYETATATPKCKKGELSPNGLCDIKKRHKGRRSCPHGFKFDGDACVKTVYVEVDVLCSKGEAVLGGKCRKELVSNALMTCPKHYHLEGGECVQFDEREPVYECIDKSYQLVHGACVAERPKVAYHAPEKAVHLKKPKKLHPKKIQMHTPKIQAPQMFQPSKNYNGSHTVHGSNGRSVHADYH